MLPRVVVCGAVLVVSCVVLFVLCDCVCGVFLFLRAYPFCVSSGDTEARQGGSAIDLQSSVPHSDAVLL